MVTPYLSNLLLSLPSSPAPAPPPLSNPVLSSLHGHPMLLQLLPLELPHPTLGLLWENARLPSPEQLWGPGVLVKVGWEEGW